MLETNIIYEQPLNEHIRFCLRLEHLFQKIKRYIGDESSFGSRIILETILEILSVVDRPDLKTKLSKALGSYAAPLAQLIQKKKLPDDIDEKKLNKLFTELSKLIESLHVSHGKIGRNLRENDFIATILQRTTTAAGTSAFCVPAYHLWLEQPFQRRNEDLLGWIENFSELKDLITLLLQLTRESDCFKKAEAKNGFYQINLDPKVSYQMIRISMSTDDSIYPEVSVGRHRLSVHFFVLNSHGHPEQVEHDVQFEIACCKI